MAWLAIRFFVWRRLRIPQTADQFGRKCRLSGPLQTVLALFRSQMRCAERFTSLTAMFRHDNTTMTMLAANFRYVRPSTLAEALTAMGEAGAMVLAGGQTLVPRLSAGDVAPSVLVDLARWAS